MAIMRAVLALGLLTQSTCFLVSPAVRKGASNSAMMRRVSMNEPTDSAFSEAAETMPAASEEPAAAKVPVFSEKQLQGDIFSIVQAAAITGAFYLLLVTALDDEWLAAPVDFSGLPGGL